MRERERERGIFDENWWRERKIAEGKFRGWWLTGRENNGYCNKIGKRRSCLLNSQLFWYLLFYIIVG